MKFGGTSVANIDRIRNVARHVKREVDAGHDVAVVVSAMAGKTNELVAWCTEASPMHDAREYDAVVASGEQVTAGLTAIVLQAMGIKLKGMEENPHLIKQYIAMEKETGVLEEEVRKLRREHPENSALLQGLTFHLDQLRL